MSVMRLHLPIRSARGPAGNAPNIPPIANIATATFISVEVNGASNLDWLG